MSMSASGYCSHGHRQIRNCFQLWPPNTQQFSPMNSFSKTERWNEGLLRTFKEWTNQGHLNHPHSIDKSSASVKLNNNNSNHLLWPLKSNHHFQGIHPQLGFQSRHLKTDMWNIIEKNSRWRTLFQDTFYPFTVHLNFLIPYHGSNIF